MSATPVAAGPALKAGGRSLSAQPALGILGWIERHVGLTPAGLAVIGVVVAGVGVGRVLQSRGLTLAAYGLLFVVGLSWVLGRRTSAPLHPGAGRGRPGATARLGRRRGTLMERKWGGKQPRQDGQVGVHHGGESVHRSIGAVAHCPVG